MGSVRPGLRLFMVTKPMLAGECEDINTLVFPLLATPKLDGIRCLMINGKAVSRTFKPIPNDHIRRTIENMGIDGLDGEIMIEGRAFNDLSGDVRRPMNPQHRLLCVFLFLYLCRF